MNLRCGQIVHKDFKLSEIQRNFYFSITIHLNFGLSKKGNSCVAYPFYHLIINYTFFTSVSPIKLNELNYGELCSVFHPRTHYCKKRENCAMAVKH